MAQNYRHLSQVLIVCGFLGVVFVTSVVVWVNQAAMKTFQRVGERIMVWFVVAAFFVFLTGLAIIIFDLSKLGR